MFCPPMVRMYACYITSNSLCISVVDRELLECSRQTRLNDILLFLDGRSEPCVVELSYMIRRLFRGRGRGAGPGVGRWGLRVQLGTEWLPI